MWRHICVVRFERVLILKLSKILWSFLQFALPFLNKIIDWSALNLMFKSTWNYLFYFAVLRSVDLETTNRLPIFKLLALSFRYPKSLRRSPLIFSNTFNSPSGLCVHAAQRSSSYGTTFFSQVLNYLFFIILLLFYITQLRPTSFFFVETSETISGDERNEAFVKKSWE